MKFNDTIPDFSFKRILNYDPIKQSRAILISSYDIYRWCGKLGTLFDIYSDKEDVYSEDDDLRSEEQDESVRSSEEMDIMTEIQVEDQNAAKNDDSEDMMVLELYRAIYQVFVNMEPPPINDEKVELVKYSIIYREDEIENIVLEKVFDNYIEDNEISIAASTEEYDYETHMANECETRLEEEMLNNMELQEDIETCQYNEALKIDITYETNFKQTLLCITDIPPLEFLPQIPGQKRKKNKHLKQKPRTQMKEELEEDS